MFFYLFLIILIGAAIAWYEVPKLIRGQMWPELAAHLVLLVLGLALAIALTLHLQVPNLTDTMRAVFDPLGQLITD